MPFGNSVTRKAWAKQDADDNIWGLEEMLLFCLKKTKGCLVKTSSMFVLHDKQTRFLTFLLTIESFQSLHMRELCLNQ